MSRTPGLVLCALLAACDSSTDPAQSETSGGTTDGTAPGSTSGAGGTSVAQTETGQASTDGEDVTEGDGSTESTGQSGSGCGVDPGLSGAVPGEVDIDGQARRFLLVLPEGYDADRAYPFVFMFHGRGGDGPQFRTYNGVEEASDNNAILVYPDALPNAQQGGLTGWDLSANGIDIAFMDQLLADFTANLCIDETRIFATGHSHGGFFSNAMGCARGETIRAIAPVAGGGPGAGCEGSVAAWLAHHTDDDVVPVALGKITRDHWVEDNGCSEETTPTDPEPCVAYQGCNEGHDVVWCEHTLEESFGPHAWPSFAGPAIWTFFSAY